MHMATLQRLVSSGEKLFPELRKEIVAKGLYEKKPVYTVVSFFVHFGLFSFGIGALFFIQTPWFLITDGIFLAAISAQFGFFMHDAGHRQVSAKTWVNDVVGYIAAFMNGTSFYSWMMGHNEHHNHPNHDDLDPDIDVYFVAYSEEEVDRSSGLRRFCTRFQAWYLFPIYTFTAHFMRYGSIPSLLKIATPKVIALNLIVIAAWHVVYYGGLFAVLGFWNTALFVFVHQGLTGVYLSAVFAPNHKGMPMFTSDSKIDWFTRQVCTARNIKSNWLINYLYGGLNFQIEHHLYPTMPRVHLAASAPITKAYCEQHNVEYYETGVIRAYREVVAHVAQVAAYARNPQKSFLGIKHKLVTAIEQFESDMHQNTHSSPEDVHDHAVSVLSSLKEDLSQTMITDMKKQAAKEWEELVEWSTHKLEEIESTMQEKSAVRKQKLEQYFFEVKQRLKMRVA